MTEHEWLECDDPRQMLEFLRGNVSERKLRLFACASCRRVWNLLIEGNNLSAQRAVITAERFADGLATKKELHAAKKASYELFAGEGRITRNASVHNALGAAWSTTKDATSSAMSTVWLLGGTRPQKWVAPLLYEVFGNPFRLYPAPAIWPVLVVRLAEAKYNGQDCGFALHDALLETGHPELAAHFRQEVSHPRGCWALDLLLGRE